MTGKPMTEEDIGIVEKLERTVQQTRLYHTNRTAPPIECKVDELVNPDGPEAAAIIMEMVEALEEARKIIIAVPISEMVGRIVGEDKVRTYNEARGILGRSLSSIDTLIAKVSGK